MAVQTIKIPKKFADICGLIRDGQEDGFEKLQAYKGLEHQKIAVMAQCAYFDGDFTQGLELDMELCPYWDEWHYGNIRSEHVAAMAFAARALEREDEVIRFFEGQIALSEADTDLPQHIKKSHVTCYQNHIAQIKTGLMPHFNEKETYRPPENPLSVKEIRAILEERIKAKKDKPKDFGSTEGIYSLFLRCAREGVVTDALGLYEQIADLELPHSIDWQITALACYNYIGDEAKGFDVVLRIARQRLWFVAAATQVRPMDFFRHPAILPYLSNKAKLERIKQAACECGN